MITNEDKKQLKDMKPEERNALWETKPDELEGFFRDQWIEAKTVAVLSQYYGIFHPSHILRQKPKALTPNELYKAVYSLTSECIPQWSPAPEILELIKQLEGFDHE